MTESIVPYLHRGLNKRRNDRHVKTKEPSNITVICLRNKQLAVFFRNWRSVVSSAARIGIDSVSGESQEEGEVDKRISTIVKVINSQVWRSYCPALYPTARIKRTLDHRGYIFIKQDTICSSKYCLDSMAPEPGSQPFYTGGANSFLRPASLETRRKRFGETTSNTTEK